MLRKVKEPSQSDEVLAVKDEESERPIPTAWRQQFREIVDAFVVGDFGLGVGIRGVPPVSADRASLIRDYIEGYGATLVALPEETWDSSVCIWYGDHWAALVDLWTEQEGRSDLVLHTRVRELDSGFSIEVDLVYVP